MSSHGKSHARTERRIATRGPREERNALATKQARPIAAIDAGSNTIHLSVVRMGPDGRLRLLADTSDMVRLGADVTERGAIGPEREQNAIAAVRRQVALARDHGATRILAIATEGVRRATNAAAFLEHIRAETGLAFELITGEQEASLAYWGATSESGASAPAHAAPRGVIDLGGGSLELIIGEGDSVTWRSSLPLGAGVTRRRLLPHDPPSFAEIIAAYDAIRADLAACALPALPAPLADLTVCGGTATALATVAGRALRRQSTGYLPAEGPTEGVAANVGRHRGLSKESLDALIGLLLTSQADEIARRYRVREERARLLLPGALTLFACMERFGVNQLWVSRRGIREGAITAWLRTHDGWLVAATLGSLS